MLAPIIESARNTLRDARHGAALKVFAVGCRAAFLFVIAPRLGSGELAEYVFLASVAAVLGRLIGLGLEEQLPLIVGGKTSEARLFTPIVNMLITLQLVLTSIYLASPSAQVATALLTICYVTTSFLAGLIRTIRVTGAERLRDLHWPIFFCLCLFPIQWTAVQLVALLASALMALQLLEIALNNVSGISHKISLRHARQAIALVRIGVRRSSLKLLSGANTLLLARALVLWPNLVTTHQNLDELAYAILLGEAFLQTAMIIVYRKYAAYCATHDSVSQILSNGISTVLLLCGYAAVCSLFIFGIGAADVEIAGFSAWETVAWLIIYFGCLAAYILLRYLVWIHRDFDWFLTLAEVVFVLVQGAVVYILPPELWPRIVALLALLCLPLAALFVSQTINADAGDNDDKIR